ncbi:hypothetical protein AB1K62_12670 [Parasphingorhabdus sp. JC815]|uniref:hypothetical protein n=1 Tax=Parasphingorhabdus sp. JC815 TaxID=3232140 RepID=UPI003459BB2F
MTTDVPNAEHIEIEAFLRGLTQLLPEEGFMGWKILESRKRNPKTKILRLTKAGEPRLAFERLGEPINFWMPINSFDPTTSKLPIPQIRTEGTTKSGANAPGRNPGYHSNIGSFFKRPNAIWFINLTSINDVRKLVKVL